MASSSTRVKPGGSPLGETSQVPSAPDVATRQNGEAASQSLSRSCSRMRSLVTARGIGVPRSSLSSASDEISTRLSVTVMALPPWAPARDRTVPLPA